MNAYEYEKMLEKESIEQSSKLAKQQFCHHDDLLAIEKGPITVGEKEYVRCICLECELHFDALYSDVASRAIKVNNLQEYNLLRELYIKLKQLNTPTYEIVNYIILTMKMLKQDKNTKTR